MSKRYVPEFNLGDLIRGYLEGEEGVSVQDIVDLASIVDARELIHGNNEGGYGVKVG